MFHDEVWNLDQKNKDKVILCHEGIQEGTAAAAMLFTIFGARRYG
jgi:hypothetical protein